ncbi:MAG: PIN domain-containing protein [Chloroflexi bacterium]|nr:PIN domain-containing protein [Chloroflexota bacterium]
MSGNKPVVYFLDTNILVYAFDRSSGIKHDIAADLVRSCWENGNGCISIQVLQEFIVNVTRKIASPLNIQEVRQIITDLAQWRVHSPEPSDLLHALDYQDRYQLSFWDAMVLQSAARLGCTKLLSEDLNHGQDYTGIQIQNPFKENT